MPNPTGLDPGRRPATGFPALGSLSGKHDKFSSCAASVIFGVQVVSGHSPHSNTLELNESACELVTQMNIVNHIQEIGTKKYIKNSILFSISAFLPVSRPRTVMTYHDMREPARRPERRLPNGCLGRRLRRQQQIRPIPRTARFPSGSRAGSGRLRGSRCAGRGRRGRSGRAGRRRTGRGWSCAAPARP